MRGLVRKLEEEQKSVKEAEEEEEEVVVRRVQRRLAGHMKVALRRMTWTCSTSRRSRRACDGVCATRCT